MSGKKNNWPALIVRVPPHFKDWLEYESNRNGASQNSEIVRCIRLRMESEAAGNIALGSDPRRPIEAPPAKAATSATPGL